MPEKQPLTIQPQWCLFRHIRRPNGSRYAYGQGTLTYANGAAHSGQWLNDEFIG
ncbi:MAG: hypothetical protein FWE06_04540 [Oscillospiraceae bacterium]|nr:hypothetical protein [Oscillospiraceae bacterium]